MRRPIAELTLTQATLLLGAGLALGQPPAPAPVRPAAPSSTPAAKEVTPPPVPEKALTAGLEELLTNALRNNPDIRVAEAKLHEAEAELNRIRLQVMQKVITFRHAVETQKAAVREAEQNLQEKQRLASARTVSQGELREAQGILGKAKARLATVEAEMPSLLGKLPQTVSQQKTAQWADKSALIPMADGSILYSTVPNLYVDQFLTSRYVNNFPLVQYKPLNPGFLNPTLFLAAPAPAVAGSMADRIRKALDVPVTVAFKEMPLPAILKELQQKQGVTILANLAQGRHSQALSCSFTEPVPFGAVLEALEDMTGVRVVVRDYGILVMDSTRLPVGATPLHDFWKRPLPGHEPKPGASTSQPPQDTEGLVKAIDPKTGYVTLSIGSDAGLSRGNTLQVYRLRPEPAYLGTVEVLAVRPNEAVAKPITRARGQIQVGDQVATRITSGRR